MSLKGSCFCGQVRYEVSGPVLQIAACHCNLCRRMSGAAFTTYLLVRNEDFTLFSGQSMLSRVSLTERMTKHFCAHCGAPIFNSNAAVHAGLAMLYLGTVVGSEEFAPRIDIFCDDKLPWVVLDERRLHFPQAFRREES